ncbi:MAG: ABC transporter ATP-binding protein, partial [Alphaproteobacteria bacterium]|nr:ABC transporter ATP-binding protein [Alphaproteobacteria bacterium]
MARISLSSVVKRFGDTVAVDRLDLDLAPGSLSTLLGPSGCGKTTTLRMIAGLDHPSSGRVAIDDAAVFDDRLIVPAERRNIGMVFQSYAVWPHLTVFENVAYPLRVRRARGAALTTQVSEALRIVR